MDIKLQEHPSSCSIKKETWRAKFSRNKTMIGNKCYLTTVIQSIYKFLGLIVFECVVTFKTGNKASGTAHCLQKNLVCTRLPACRSEQALHSGLNLGFSYLSGKWRSVIISIRFHRNKFKCCLRHKQIEEVDRRKVRGIN